MYRSTATPITALILLIVCATASADEPTLWHVELDARRIGPVEFYLELSSDGASTRGKSQSGTATILQELPGAQDVSLGVFVFDATRMESGRFSGPLLAPWKKGSIDFAIVDGQLLGNIEDSILAGKITARPVSAVETIRDYAAILDEFDAVVASKIYSSKKIRDPSYQAFRFGLERIAANATDDLDLLFGFRWAWQNDPFSHFQLKRSHQSAEQLFGHFDQLRVGFDAATVEFDRGVAVLTVRTMMGNDTIEQINAAYEKIATESPSALIVDLRGNRGGAFAIKPLIEHVIDEPLDAGYFLSQLWTRENDGLPTKEEVEAGIPWDGWSIVDFWKTVQAAPIVRVQFNPATPNYDGPVFVLLDAQSASATELAADAFRASGLVTVIGEPSAGEMLSQSMFDVGDGFIVSLPVADYYSMANGRIEGAGVKVDIAVESAQALNVARQLVE